MEYLSTKGTMFRNHFMALTFFDFMLLLAVVRLTERAHSLSRVRRSQRAAVLDVLELCWAAWSRAAAESRRKEAEEQNLYKYRQKTHVIEEGEGEQLEQELKRVFPVYEEYMEEEEGSCDVDEGSCDVEGGRDGSVSGAQYSTDGFSPEELDSIATLHLYLYRKNGSVPLKACGVTSVKISYDLAGVLARSVDAIPGVYGVVAVTF